MLDSTNNKGIDNTFNYIKYQDVCTSRQHKQVKRQPTDWENILSKCLTDKG